MSIYLTAFKLLFSALSAICYFISALIQMPEPPKTGDVISAKYPQELNKSLTKMSTLSAFGAIFICITLILECITLML